MFVLCVGLCVVCVFFSSRRRHTRCALVTGVQTCALPIWDTSGCLLLARHPKAHKRFAADFEARQVVKGYVAVLQCVPAEQSGMIDLPLYQVSSAEEGWRMVLDKRGKSARTAWEKLTKKAQRSNTRYFYSSRSEVQTLELPSPMPRSFSR